MKSILKQFLILFFCLTSIITFSQPNYYKIQGAWVSIKNLNKYNNTLADQYYCKFTFKGSKLYISSSPTYIETSNPVPFEVKGDLIKTSILDDSGYMIEKVSKDTLIIANSFDNNKARRFILINERTLTSENLKQVKEDGVLIADKYCTPTQKKNLQKVVQEFFLGKIKDNFEIKGSFNINLESKYVDTELSSSNVNDKILKKLKEVLDTTFDYWDVSLFDKFKQIKISFVIQGYRVQNFESLKISFY